MFTGFSQQSIDFLWGIRINNEKGWFEENKETYQAALLQPMKALGEEALAQLKQSHGEYGLGLKVARIYRDARRLYGKGPYRDHLWFSITHNGEDSAATPVLWFYLSPEAWSYGVGYYEARAATMTKLRVRIDADPAAFEAFIAPLETQDEFTLDGPDYAREKTAPSAKTQPWYNKKSLGLTHEQPMDAAFYQRDLLDRIVAGYRFLMPYYAFFTALEAQAT